MLVLKVKITTMKMRADFNTANQYLRFELLELIYLFDKQLTFISIYIY